MCASPDNQALAAEVSRSIAFAVDLQAALDHWGRMRGAVDIPNAISTVRRAVAHVKSHEWQQHVRQVSV